MFKQVSAADVAHIIKTMSNNKASGRDIPINILIRSYFTCRKIKDSINHVINTNGKFPDSLKSFNIMPVFKKDEPTHKEN